jgi:hypothetical protein
MITRTESICFVMVVAASGVVQYFLFQQSWMESFGRGVVIGIAVTAVIVYQGRKRRQARKHPSRNDE